MSSVNEICGENFGCWIALKHIVPLAGCIPLIYLQVSPIKEVLRIERTGHVGVFDANPYAWLCVAALSWIVYGILITDWYILVPNIIGFLCGTYYVMSLIRFAPLTTQRRLLRIIMAGYTVVLVSAMISFLVLLPNHKPVALILVGVENILGLMLMNAAPLLHMPHIIKTRNSAPIYVPFTVGVFITSAMFAVYGVVLKDVMIIVPNAINVMLASAQFALVLLFPRSKEITQETHSHLTNVC